MLLVPVIFFCNNNYHLFRKNYNSLLITHIINGTFTYVKKGESITATTGDTVILDCYKPHEYYTDDGFESIWVHVAGANSFELFKEIKTMFGNKVKCVDNDRVQKILFSIYNGIRDDAPSTELNLSLDIYKLFTELLKSQTTNITVQSSQENSIEEVKNYINEHLNEDLSVKKLAGLIFMSPSHFSRVFKQNTGFSPYDYVLVTRLNKAKTLLQNTDEKISTIAIETGFNSESNFIYFFTVNVGMSPRKFRKLKF